MPWCNPCERYFTPATVRVDGTCPDCGEEVEHPEGRAGADGADSAGERYRAPWHFKLMVVATVVYVGWRIVQLVTGGLAG